MDNIGHRLREERQLRGWSQRDLAHETGVNTDTISGIETGQHEPRPSTLRKLAGGLGIEVRDLFTEPALPKAEAPSGAGQPEEGRSVRDIARAEARRQFEIDLQAANRTLAAEGIRQPARISDIYDPARYDALRQQPPDELAGALLDAERDNVRLEYENSSQAIQLDQARRDSSLLEQEVVELKQEVARLREETAKLHEQVASTE